MAPRKNEAVTGTTDPDSATAGSAEAPRGKGPADGPPPPAGPPAPQGARLARTTSAVLAGLASQAVILTAVLFYFGWARAKATYGYFGVDISVLDFPHRTTSCAASARRSRCWWRSGWPVWRP